MSLKINLLKKKPKEEVGKLDGVGKKYWKQGRISC